MRQDLEIIDEVGKMPDFNRVNERRWEDVPSECEVCGLIKFGAGVTEICTRCRSLCVFKLLKTKERGEKTA